MNITLEMILTDFWELFPDTRINTNKNMEQIKGVLLLPDQREQLEAGYLYISADAQDLALTVENKLAIINIPTKMHSLSESFNSLFNCYRKYEEWGKKLDYAVFQDVNFQDLIDCCSGILKAPLLVYDPTLKLLAYSKECMEQENNLFLKAKESGYLNLESVKYFVDTKTFEEVEKLGHAYGFADAVRIHDDLIKTIQINHQLVIYFIMLYTDQYPRSYMNALYDILYDAFYQLLDKKHDNFVRNRSVTDFFLMDLLDNPDTTEMQIKERNYYHDLPYADNYILINIKSAAIVGSSVSYYVDMLRNNLIHCRIFQYHGSILILHALSENRKYQYKESIKEMLGFVKNQFMNGNFTALVSRPFADLSYFASAYQQTEGIALLPTTDCFVFFEDLVVDYLINNIPVKHRDYDLCSPVVREIKARDNKKSRQLLLILKEYLNNDRNPTKVASILDMHRNNVIYHIKSFEEQYGIDLSDSEERLKLMLSLRDVT